LHKSYVSIQTVLVCSQKIVVDLWKRFLNTSSDSVQYRLCLYFW